MTMTIAPLLAAAEGAGSGGGAGLFVPIILMMAMFYFLMIRPQRKQAKALEKMRSDLPLSLQNVSKDVASSVNCKLFLR